MKVKEVELTFTIVEGEAEEKFLEKAITDMKNRRSNQKGKGGRGKQHFTRKRKNDGGHETQGKRTKADRD